MSFNTQPTDTVAFTTDIHIFIETNAVDVLLVINLHYKNVMSYTRSVPLFWTN